MIKILIVLFCITKGNCVVYLPIMHMKSLTTNNNNNVTVYAKTRHW